MVRSVSQRVRGLLYLVTGIIAGVLLVRLAIDPAPVANARALPLFALLALAVLIAFWQAKVLLH